MLRDSLNKQSGEGPEEDTSVNLWPSHTCAHMTTHIHIHTYIQRKKKKGVPEYAVQTVRERVVNDLLLDGLVDSFKATVGKPCGKLSCGLISIRCFS